MRLVSRLLLGVAALILLSFIFMPPLIGIGVQRNSHFILPLNSDNVSTEILDYKRGWFSSDMTIKVILKDADLPHLLEGLILRPNVQLPMEFILKGHVQHGPIFYSPLDDMPCMGLVLVNRQIEMPVAYKSMLKEFNLDAALFRINAAYLGFTGKYLNYLALRNLHYVSRLGHDFKVKNIETQIWRWPFSSHIHGYVKVKDVATGDLVSSLRLPHLKVEFDLKKDAYGLWIGDHALSLSTIEMRDADDVFQLSGIEFGGSVHEKAALVSGDKRFKIGKILFDEQSVGPLHVHISVKNLNAQAIANLLDAYQDILRHGEMYESQLRQRTFTLLPTLIAPGGGIQLNNFNIKTPDGQLKMHANVFWPKQDFIPLENMRDLVDTANVQAALRISIPLADEIMGLMAKLSYSYQISQAERQALIAMDDELPLKRQQVVFMVANLLQLNLIPQVEGDALLAQIQNNVSVEDYLQAVKELLLQNKINLATSYYLGLIYIMLDNQFNELDQKVAVYQQATERLIRSQLNEYIKRGYILKSQDEYSITLSRDKSKFVVNGNVISNKK
jgi:uncharacterized protein YdgA (DUF945 family)